MARGSLGHAAYWSLVGFAEDSDDTGGFPVDDEEVAVVVLGCRSDPESRQRMVVSIVGPVCGAETVATVGCPACGDSVRVPMPPWLVALAN